MNLFLFKEGFGPVSGLAGKGAVLKSHDVIEGKNRPLKVLTQTKGLLCAINNPSNVIY